MAVPKMTEKEWRKARLRWEAEEDAGFAWLVRDLKLPVTAPAVRKRAAKEGWVKNPIPLTERAATTAMAPLPKAGKPRSGEKPEQETTGTALTDEPVPVDDLVNRFGLNSQQALLAREFMVDFNALKAAIRAGYSEVTAKSKSAEMVANPRMQAAIAFQMRERLERMGRDSDELVRFHLEIIDFDPNDVCELRIHACKYCWGVDHTLQHDPVSWGKERDKFQKRWNKMSEDEQKVVGDFPAVPPDGWYEAKRGPHDDCPQCHGVGIEVVKWKDTRFMAPNVRRLFGGVKMNKEGLEIVMLQKSASLTTISNHLGLNKVAEIVQNTAIVTESMGVYEAIMAKSRERQRLVLEERGLIEHGSE